MKNIILLLIGAFTLTLTSCGTFAAYSDGGSQKYEDGIYSSAPSLKNRTEADTDKQEIENLIQQTKESPIYLFGDKKDSIILPENMAATLRFDKDLGTSVTIGYTDSFQTYSDYWNSPWYYNYYSSPWSYRGWYDPWSYRYGPWHYGSYWGGYYGGYYSGFYGRYYNPWYYDPWYFDPWYHDPFYHYMHPYYCGWYGAWDPYYGAIIHRPHYGGGHHHGAIGSSSGKGIYKGSRHETVSSSGKAVAGQRSSTSLTPTSRKTATTSRSSFGTSRSTSARSTSGQTATYRKPTGTTTQRSTGSSPTYYKGTSRSSSTEPKADRSTNSSSYYERNTSRSQPASVPSYNRGSGYSGGSSYRGSSSYHGGSSGGSYQRSSSGRR